MTITNQSILFSVLGIVSSQGSLRFTNYLTYILADLQIEQKTFFIAPKVCFYLNTCWFIFYNILRQSSIGISVIMLQIGLFGYKMYVLIMILLSINHCIMQSVAWLHTTEDLKHFFVFKYRRADKQKMTHKKYSQTRATYK